MPHRITIERYDDRWPAEFDRIGRSLRRALGDLALRIDHIGSTAVPGLAARDVIDVQVTVVTLDAEPIAAALTAFGYTLGAGLTSDHVPPGREATLAEWQKLYVDAPTW